MCSLALHDSEKSVIYASASLLFVILHWMNGIIPLIKVATLLDQAESPCMILTPGETAELFIFRDLDAISGSFGALQDGIPQDIFIVFWDYCTWRFFVLVPSALSHGSKLLNPGCRLWGVAPILTLALSLQRLNVLPTAGSSLDSPTSICVVKHTCALWTPTHPNTHKVCLQHLPFF